MRREAVCPDIEIFQGEGLEISNGKIYDDCDKPIDISSGDWDIVAEITSGRGYRRMFSTSSSDDTKIYKNDDGTFSFFLDGTDTEHMLGTYFIAFRVTLNGKPMMSPQVKAFEVCQSGIGRNY